MSDPKWSHLVKTVGWLDTPEEYPYVAVLPENIWVPCGPGTKTCWHVLDWIAEQGWEFALPAGAMPYDFHGLKLWFKDPDQAMLCRLTWS